MIVFINGSYGVGKSTVAQLLLQKLPNSMVFDPELIGEMLHQMLDQKDRADDFQHYPLWRSLTVDTTRKFKEQYGRDLIVPKTLWRPQYFDEVLGGLKALDTVHHFTLTAPLPVIHERIVARNFPGQVPGSWVYKQSEVAVEALKSHDFARHVPTEQRTPEDIAEEILAAIR